MSPFPNNHACLIDGSLRVVGSQTRTHNGKRYVVRIGRKRGGGGSGERSYLYPTDDWSRAEAAAHCKSHGGTFEPASGNVQETEADHANPAINPLIRYEEEK